MLLRKSQTLVAFSILLFLVLPTNSLSWDGYNNDTGTSFEVESYDHGGRGEGEVEFYDFNSGEYRSGYLDMHPGGSGELTDYSTGETYSVDMD